MPYIALNKTEYYYQKSGKGSPILFAHGLFVDNTIFKNQIDNLQNTFSCYAFDMPAHGKSSYKKDGWTLDDIVEDFRLFIGKENLQNVVLVGQSQGGMVFMRLAIKYPELVSKLILIGTSAKEEYALKIPFWQNMVQTFRNGSATDFKNCMTLVQKNVVSSHFINKFPEETAKELSVMQNQNPFGMALATESAILNRTNVSSFLAKINCLTLIVCGQDDTATPIEASTEIKENIKHSKMVVISQSAHHIPIENPDELNLHIIDFIK